jgi:restriction endonuclease Mrr
MLRGYIREHEGRLNSLGEDLAVCERERNPIPWMMAALLALVICCFIGWAAGAARGASFGLLVGFILACPTVPVPIVWFALRKQRADKRYDELMDVQDEAEDRLPGLRTELEERERERAQIAKHFAEADHNYQRLADITKLADAIDAASQRYRELWQRYVDPWNTAELARLEQESREREERRRRQEAEQRRREEEERRRRQEAEEAPARAKWKLYHESKTMEDVAGMTGPEFEAFLARLFSRMGYTDISTTATNDQGGDILCLSPRGVRIVVQAKRWKGTVGNSAVQELLGAMRFYSRTEGMVVTNSTFTDAARELANAGADITLCDARWLAEQIKRYLPPEVPAFSWDEYNRVVKGWQPARAGGMRKPRSGRYMKRRWY